MGQSKLIFEIENLSFTQFPVRQLPAVSAALEPLRKKGYLTTYDKVYPLTKNLLCSPRSTW